MSPTVEMAFVCLALVASGLAILWWSGKRLDKRFPPRR